MKIIFLATYLINYKFGILLMDNMPDFLKLENVEKQVDYLCNFLHDEVIEKFHKHGAIVGLSGGIDSTVTMALCVKALGSTKTILKLFLLPLI